MISSIMQRHDEPLLLRSAALRPWKKDVQKYMCSRQNGVLGMFT